MLNAKTPRINEHAHALLKTIFATAVQNELLDRNPRRERMRKPVRQVLTKSGRQLCDPSSSQFPTGPRRVAFVAGDVATASPTVCIEWRTESADGAIGQAFGTQGPARLPN